MGADRQIIVVDRSILLKDEFQGFKHHDKFDYEAVILANIISMSKNAAEVDATKKQPTAYAVIVNPKLKKVFAYQRASKDKGYSEKRLQGKWSWGAGGHIEPYDTGKGNPIYVSLRRELEEELGLTSVKAIKKLGYINDDSNEVGKVHFGVALIVETDSDEIKMNKEIAQGRFVDVSELEKICSHPDYDVETWSRILLGPVSDYLRNL